MIQNQLLIITVHFVGAADKLVEYYKSFVNESDIATEFEIPGEHAIVRSPYCISHVDWQW
jgi:hypothetical protein